MMLRKLLYTFLSLLFIFILTACGKASKEDVIEHVQEKIDLVETYNTEAEMDITITDPSDTIIEESSASSNIHLNEKTVESSGKMTEDEQTTHYYSTEEATYAQIGDGPWEDKTAQAENFKHLESSYANVAQVIIDLKNEEGFEMEEQDEKYLFTFSGKSEAVFQAFEQPYSLTLEGAAPKDVTQDVQMTVDRESYVMEDVQYNLFVEIEGHALEMIVHQTFGQINDIDDIEIPQEVIQEAEEQTAGSTADENIVHALAHLEEKIDNVQSYSTMMGLFITVRDTSTNEVLDQSEETSNSEVIEEPLQVYESIEDSDGRGEYYTTDEGTYVKFPGEEWQDFSDQDDIFREDNITYNDVAQIILAVGEEDGVKMEEDDDGNVAFLFTGKSVSVYETFQEPYSLSLTGVEPKDMEHNIQIIVNSETNVIQQIENTMRAEVDGQELELQVLQTYENINEIDPIEIPQEVMDEAS